MTILGLEMADYRRELHQYGRKNIIDKYKNLRDAKGGLFTPTMRRRLLGVKLQSSREYKEDTADFWYDVRKTVKSGLKDLELICDMAHPDQLKEMFTETLFNEEKAEMANLPNATEKERFLKRMPSVEKWLRALFSDYVVYHYAIDKQSGRKYTKSDIIGDDSWQAYLANNIVSICMQFFKEHNFISTKAHARLVEEVEDMLNIEVARGTKLKRNERVKTPQNVIPYRSTVI